MKGFKKILGAALTLMLVCTTGISKPNACELHKTDIRIHKIAMESFEGFPKVNLNAEEKDISYFGSGAGELAGVKFNYYEVDQNEYYAELSDADLAAVPEADLKAAIKDPNSGVRFIDSFVTTATGYLIQQLTDGRYIFYEEDSESDMVIKSSLAVPFVLNLPAARTDKDGNVVYNNDGNVEYLSFMNIYPKNIIEEPIPKKYVREIGNTEDSQEVGVDLPYILTTSIPKNIAKYNEFNFVDILEDTLNYKSGSITAKVNDNNIDTSLVKGTDTFDFTGSNADYYVFEPSTTSGGTLTVKFTQAGLKKISDANIDLNGKLIVEYNAKINSTAKVVYDTLLNNKGDEITNSFDIHYMDTFIPNNNPDNPGPPFIPGPDKKVSSNEVYVYIGGKTFIKTNDYEIDNDNKLLKYLEGATFALCYENGEPVTWTDELIAMNKANGENAAKFSGTIAFGEQIILRSGAGGTFEIKGLKAAVNGNFDGNYKLEEATAPDGYVKLNVPITFTVVKNGYDTASPQQIKNAKKPSIPQTGGIGAIIFLAAGLALMGAAVFALKRKEHPEK